MIKKAVYRSSGRRVRGEDDKIFPIKKKVAPDLPLDALRSMDIRVDPWSAPTCAPPSAYSPRTGQSEWRARQSERRSELRGVGPVPPDRRARLQCSTDFDTYACGELEDSAKIRKYWDEWHLSRPHRVG